MQAGGTLQTRLPAPLFSQAVWMVPLAPVFGTAGAQGVLL